ncbi:MAG: YjbE family putative metal transport protein [Hydrogenophilaceae bacterium]|nr:YjbE family putative metal transport protein [Hydrogenophilaceae bacterium]
MDSIIADVTAFVSVILIDLALAGDNAVAVGLAASRLDERRRRQVIFLGVVLALLLRIIFAVITLLIFNLTAITGILFAGGLLLVWVAWRMWEDYQAHEPSITVGDPEAGAVIAAGTAKKIAAPATFAGALFTVVLADVSMSLDNVLAVAAVARHNMWIMVFGLVLSVVLMGVAATFIARVIQRYRWIALVGIAIILLAAARMMWEDLHVWFPDVIPGMPSWMTGGHAPAAAAH